MIIKLVLLFLLLFGWCGILSEHFFEYSVWSLMLSFWQHCEPWFGYITCKLLLETIKGQQTSSPSRRKLCAWWWIVRKFVLLSSYPSLILLRYRTSLKTWLHPHSIWYSNTVIDSTHAIYTLHKIFLFTMNFPTCNYRIH